MLLTGKMLLVREDGTMKVVSSAQEARDSINGRKAIGYTLSVAMTFGHNKAEQRKPKEEQPEALKEAIKDDSLPVKTAKKKAK